MKLFKTLLTTIVLSAMITTSAYADVIKRSPDLSPYYEITYPDFILVE